MGMQGAPTVELHTEVLELIRRGHRAWVSAGRDFPTEADWVYSVDELTRALYVYSATTARFMPVEKLQFRLVARSLTVGGVVGIHEWRVSQETGQWVPADAPWVLWDGAVQLAA